MAVYVDPLFSTEPSKKWPYKQACHLTADNDQELHTFAHGLGLQRAWFQPGRGNNQATRHYDLTASKRALALRRGAIPLTFREFGDRVLRGGASC